MLVPGRVASTHTENRAFAHTSSQICYFVAPTRASHHTWKYPRGEIEAATLHINSPTHLWLLWKENLPRYVELLHEVRHRVLWLGIFPVFFYLILELGGHHALKDSCIIIRDISVGPSLLQLQAPAVAVLSLLTPAVTRPCSVDGHAPSPPLLLLLPVLPKWLEKRAGDCCWKGGPRGGGLREPVKKE